VVEKLTPDHTNTYFTEFDFCKDVIIAAQTHNNIIPGKVANLHKL